MAKPPPATPHSDLDGVREDAKAVPEAARESGEGAAPLAEAARRSARPHRSREDGADDRAG